jgi:hypothetical protein
MFVLRLTSDDSVIGLESDDGFTIGRFSGDTFFLVLFMTAIGMAGGVFYLIVRGWLPAPLRAAAIGAFGAAVGGAIVVHPDGIDFVVLEPQWLAIAMFVALPAIYGVAMSLLAERFLRTSEEGRRRGWLATLLPLLPVLAFGPFGLMIVAVSLLIWWLSRLLPLAAIWRSSAVTWIGRAALVALAVFSTIALIGDITKIV